MAKKYDTNPLDGEVLQKAEEVRRKTPLYAVPPPNSESQTQFFEAQTRQFVAAAAVTPAVHEVATQPLGSANLEEPYQSVFNKSQVLADANNHSVSSAVQKLIVPPTSRKVIGLGLPENFAMLLPYMPLTAGAVAAAIILLLSSRSETRVRFHAAQGLALHIASWLLALFAGGIAAVLPLDKRFAAQIIPAALAVFFIVCLVRVWQGKPNHIEALDDITDFLNEKIKPRK